MKRTISLVIAIAVMISMFIVPASAADYVVDMTALEAYNFELAGITDIVGFHYATGGQEGNNSLGTLDLSGYKSMKITYSNGVPESNTDIKDIVLVNGAGEEIGTLDTIGTGWWGTFTVGYIDISAVTSTSDTYTLKANPEVGGNGIWVTGVALSNDDAPLQPMDASNIQAGTTVLDRDVKGQLNIGSGTYVIDLAGHTWTHSAIALYIDGANVTVIDSVGGGKIHVKGNDAIDIEAGSLTATGITVIAESSGMDAIFVGGGTVVANNCTLDGGKSGINASASAVDITVNGGTFANDYDGGDGRDAAFEFRNNAKVKLNGDIQFVESDIIRRANHSQAWADSFVVLDDKATVAFASASDSDIGVHSNHQYYANAINYTYTAPVETKLGASIEITNGIALDFVVSNAPANAVVKIDGVEFDVSYVDGQDSHYILDGFGPHTMGDEHTAELYVDDELLATKTYSVKEYCLDVIKNGKAINDAHLALAKEILNYGAKAQVYVDYDAENLVNDGVVSEGEYDPAEDVAMILNDFAGASANWVNANVKFGDTLELIINLEGDADNVDVTIGTDTVNYEVLTTAAGTKYIVVTEITPDQFRDSIAAVAYNGDVRVSKTLVYSVGSYISDRVENSTNEAYVELVKALSIYGDAVAAFVA